MTNCLRLRLLGDDVILDLAVGRFGDHVSRNQLVLVVVWPALDYFRRLSVGHAGNARNSAAVALLMSTSPALGTAAVLCDAGSEAFGAAGMAGAIFPAGGVGVVVVVADWAKTGATTVSASNPTGRRESFNIDCS